MIRKGALFYPGEDIRYANPYSLSREEAIRHIVSAAGSDMIVSTTGRASRELFEIREENRHGHAQDFLAVGSMGHASSIALGIAWNRMDRRIWCIDGDGAALMHMGAMAIIGTLRPRNLIHVVINNGAHETVGGQPTAMRKLNFWEIASACGYPHTACASDSESLKTELEKAGKRKDLTLIEVKCALGSRENLGRPSISPVENKINFMKQFSESCQEN